MESCNALSGESALFSTPFVRRGEMASFKFTPQIMLALAVLILGVGFGLGSYVGGRVQEGFEDVIPMCRNCKSPAPKCTCAGASSGGVSQLVCPPCKQPDMSKYVLKTTIPPCPSCPDLTQYMLKTQCPPVPDLSRYVLKSSIPKQQPVIIDTSACSKDAGECPPCPRARCPEVKCPPPQSCPPPAPCPRAVCPPTTVKCKAEGTPDSTVRPFLAPLNMSIFGEG
jgi:hypothetical protein